MKEALRRRHPAYEPGFAGVGRWVTLEEWANVDLLALDCWHPADVIGYEVKVSRGDMRSELLKPSKRVPAMKLCTRFYFAIPAGMMTDEERAFVEPGWTEDDFKREPCPNPKCRARHVRRGFAKKAPKPRGSRLRGTDKEGVTVHLGFGNERGTLVGGGTFTHSYEITACCSACRGYGTVGQSRVEREAPNLWVPADVGLVVVGPGGAGCSVLKESPRRKVTKPLISHIALPQHSRLSEDAAARLQRQSVHQLVRWVSARPDPRHMQSYGDRMG